MAEDIKKLHELFDQMEKRLAILEKKAEIVSAILDRVELRLRSRFDLC